VIHWAHPAANGGRFKNVLNIDYSANAAHSRYACEDLINKCEDGRIADFVADVALSYTQNEFFTRKQFEVLFQVMGLDYEQVLSNSPCGRDFLIRKVRGGSRE